MPRMIWLNVLLSGTSPGTRPQLRLMRSMTAPLRLSRPPPECLICSPVPWNYMANSPVPRVETAGTALFAMIFVGPAIVGSVSGVCPLPIAPTQPIAGVTACRVALRPFWKTLMGTVFGCLSRTIRDEALIFCTRCARHGTPNFFVKLGRICPGGPTSPSYIVCRRRLSQGFHPTRKATIDRPTPCACLTRSAALRFGTSHADDDPLAAPF